MQASQGITSQTGGQRNPNVSGNTTQKTPPGRRSKDGTTVVTINSSMVSGQRQHSQSRTGLTPGSIAKAGAVIVGTTGAYYLAKATGVFSVFGWGSSGDVSNSGAKSDLGVASYLGNSLAVQANGLDIIDQSSGPMVSQNGLRRGSKMIQFEELDVEEIEHRFVGGRSLLEVKADPTFVGSYNTPNFAYGVEVVGNYAYVADYSAGLQIIDVSDPANPTLAGSYNTPGSSFGVTVSGNYAYVANSPTLQIIDISNPANPVYAGSYNTGGALKVTVSGNYANVWAPILAPTSTTTSLARIKV